MQRYKKTENKHLMSLKQSVRVVGAFKVYIELRNNRTRFLRHSDFTERNRRNVSGDVYIDVSQIEQSIIHMKITDYMRVGDTTC